MDHPFMNVSELSDDQLADKAQKITQNLMKAQMWGSSTEVTNQLQMMLELIEEERYNRAMISYTKEITKHHRAIIESDPIQDGAEEVIEKKAEPVSKKEEVVFPMPVFQKEYIGKK